MQQKKGFDQNTISYMKSLMPQYLTLKGIDPSRPFRCLNPHHQDNKPSMRYCDFYKGTPLHKIRCFSCGATYDIFDLVMQDYGLHNWRDAANKVAEIFSLKTNEKDPSGAIAVPAAPDGPINIAKSYKDYDISNRIADAHQMVGKTAYFMARGFSPRIINEYKLGYWPEGYNDFVRPIDESLTNRLLQQRHYTFIIPILDESGTPRNFIARMNGQGTVDDYNPKTLNMKGVEMRMLNERYLTDPSTLKDAKTLFVVEGWADALSIEQAGGRAIALNAASNVERFLNLFSEHAGDLRHLVVVAAGDRDKAGQVMNYTIEHGIKSHRVPGIMQMGIRCMPFNVAGYHKDANEFLTADPKGFTEMVSGVVENRLGRFRFKKPAQDMEL